MQSRTILGLRKEGIDISNEGVGERLRNVTILPFISVAAIEKVLLFHRLVLQRGTVDTLGGALKTSLGTGTIDRHRRNKLGPLPHQHHDGS